MTNSDNLLTNWSVAADVDGKKYMIIKQNNKLTYYIDGIDSCRLPQHEKILYALNMEEGCDD